MPVPNRKPKIENRKLLLLLVVAFVFGLGLAYALAWLLPSTAASPPYAAIAASVVIDLAGLAGLLIWLPVTAGKGKAWPGTGAWLRSVLACGAALAGLSVAGVHQEPLRTFVVLWGLMAAQCAVLASVYGWLAILFRFEPRLPAQITCVLLALAVTALFWSREPIELLGRSAEGGSSSAAWLAAGVLEASPPLAVASVWHQESGAARLGTASFDIVRAPLTYQVWIGSYRAVPYPQILPASQNQGKGFRFGLLLPLLFVGMLLLVLSDVAAVRWRS
jgi:hypothetical protein